MFKLRGDDVTDDPLTRLWTKFILQSFKSSQSALKEKDKYLSNRDVNELNLPRKYRLQKKKKEVQNHMLKM